MSRAAPMEFSEVVRARRMVRDYRPDPVGHDQIERILDAGLRGPSAGFAQGQSFVVLTEAPDRQRIATLCGEQSYVARGFTPWLSRAPVHIVPCVSAGAYRQRYAASDKEDSVPPDDWGVPYWWVDGGAALMLLLLAAVDEGLAAGFLALRDEAGVRAFLGLPSDVAPLGLVTVGHPAQRDLGDRRSSSVARGRRPRHEVIHLGRWGQQQPLM